MKTNTTVTYFAADWDLADNKVIAILPVAAGEGLEELHSFADELIASKLAARFAAIRFIDNLEILSLIDAAALSSDYSDALQAYAQSSALDANVLKRMCGACGADLLFLNRLTLSSELKYYGANSVLRKQIDYNMQIWSPDAADVVWEAHAAAVATETTFDRSAELEQLISNAVDALAEEMPDIKSM